MRVGGCVGGPFCGGFPSSAGWLISCDFGKGKGRGGMGWVGWFGWFTGDEHVGVC